MANSDSRASPGRCQGCLGRRRFLGLSARAAATALIAPRALELAGCGPLGGSTVIPNAPSNSYSFDFASYPELESPGGSIFVQVEATSGTVPVAIVRLDAANAEALQAICTHAGCTVNPLDPSTHTFTCPCHGSVYSEDGSVLSGPAYMPLQGYRTQLTQTAIVATIP